MKIQKHEDYSWVKMTYDEELDYARFVMGLLCKLWMDGEFLDLLQRIYDRKVNHGKDLNLDQYNRVTELCKVFDVEPLLFKETGLCIDPIHFNEGEHTSYEEKLSYISKSIRMAWFEAWKENPGLKRVSDAYRSFPGFFQEEKPSYEDLLDAEIDRLMEELEIPYHEAKVLARDYIEA